MHHGLQVVVRAEFLVDAVPLIPRRGQSDTPSSRAISEEFLACANKRRIRCSCSENGETGAARVLRLAGGGDHFFGDLQHLGKQLFALLTTGNISSQMHNQAAVAGGVLQVPGWKRSPRAFRRSVS